MGSLRRIQRELGELQRDPPANVSAGPVNEDMYKWEGQLIGPANSPYGGGVFKINIEFSPDYPFKPPTVKFGTKIYHPNVDDDGSICIGILKSDVWKPATKIVDVLFSLLLLLEQPNPDDALQPSIGEEYRTDLAKYQKNARDWVKKYCEKVY